MTCGHLRPDRLRSANAADRTGNTVQRTCPGYRTYDCRLTANLAVGFGPFCRGATILCGKDHCGGPQGITDILAKDSPSAWRPARLKTGTESACGHGFVALFGWPGALIVYESDRTQASRYARPSIPR